MNNEQQTIWNLPYKFSVSKELFFLFLGFTALHLAVQHKQNSLELTHCLMKHQANVNTQDGKSGRTALYHAAELGKLELVEKLLRNRASINCQNFSGSTPLLAASACQHHEVVSLLVGHGADTTIKSGNMDSFSMSAKERKVSRNSTSTLDNTILYEFLGNVSSLPVAISMS